MATNKRTPFERDRDLARITTLYLHGNTQADIARELGLSQPQINYDIKTIHRRWRESSLVDMNEAKQRELAEINELQRTYYDAWERSKAEVIKTRTGRSDKDGNSAMVIKEQSVGNPAFLSGVQWCIEQRCKIFGIYEATKISLDWRRAAEEQGLDAGELFERVVNTYVSAALHD